MKKPKVKAKTHTVLMQALEEGCAFALNRAEDCGWRFEGENYDEARNRAIERMLDEMSNAFYTYLET